MRYSSCNRICRAFNAKAVLLRVLDRDQQRVSAQLFDLLNWQIHKAEAAQYLRKIDGRTSKIGIYVRGRPLRKVPWLNRSSSFAQSQGMKLIILTATGIVG